MYVALVIGLAGMALILVPGLLLEGVKLSAAGLLCAWGAGVMYAVYLLFAKSLRGLGVRSTPVVFAQSAFTAAVDARARPARRQRRAATTTRASTS